MKRLPRLRLAVKPVVWSTLTTGLPAVMALTIIGLVLSISVRRIVYPFELEWLEDGLLLQVQRVLAGQPIYVAPSLDYVAFLYPPFYSYVAAALAQVTGVSFLPLRLVSLLASLGSATMAGVLVFRHTRQRWPVLLALGLLAGTYGIALGYYDLARVDALMTFLVMSGFLVAGKDRPGDLLAALCFVLAIFTKQAALVAIAPYVLARFWYDRWQATWLIVPVGLLVGAGTLLLDAWHDGWYRFYTQDIVGFGGVAWRYLLVVVLPFYLTIFGFALAVIWPARRSLPPRLLAQMGGLMVASAVGKVHVGGAENVMLPFYVGLAILFGVALAHRPLPQVWLIATFQFFLLLGYTLTAPLVPTSEHAANARAIIAQIREVEGEVLLPSSPSLVLAAGKTPTAHLCAMQELQGGFGGGDAEAWHALQQEFQTALRERRFALILLDQMRRNAKGDLVWQPDLTLELDAPVDAALHAVLPFYTKHRLPIHQTPLVLSGWHTFPTIAFALRTDLPYVPSGRRNP